MTKLAKLAESAGIMTKLAYEYRDSAEFQDSTESGHIRRISDSGGWGRCQNVTTARVELLELTKEARISSILQDFWDEMRDRGGGVFHADALKDIRKKLDDEESLISGKALNHAHGLPAWPASQFRTSDSVIHLGDRY